MTNKTLKHLLIAFIALGFLGVVSDSIAAYRRAIEGNIPMMIFSFAFIFINAALACFYVKVHAKLVEEEQNHEWVKEYFRTMTPSDFDEMMERIKNAYDESTQNEEGNRDNTN